MNRRVDFIIPFRPRNTAKDWDRICATLQNTVNSACHSLSPNYRVLIVCHELPDINIDPTRCTFIQVDYPPPKISSDASLKEIIFQQRTDKGRKTLTGLSDSRTSGSQYFMVLDGDDYVSKHLVSYCVEQNNPNGYYFEKGYRTDPLFPNWLFKRRSFFRECGSCFVLNTLKAPFPPESENFAGKDYNNYYISRYINHPFIPFCMNKMGYPLEAIPFPAAVYHIHQENIYYNTHRPPQTIPMRTLRVMVQGKKITPELLDEFALLHQYSSKSNS